MSLFSDWTIIDDGEIDARTFNLSTSSVSALDSFTKDDFGLMTYEGFSSNFNDTKLEKTEPFGISPLLEASTGSVEPVMGLKLGKRIYFENSGGVNSSSPSKTSSKKTKSPSQNPRCIVEGCNFDLSKAKEYHRKHRVCDAHSKSSKVVVGGLERRFCQQCSRFHNLSEFDEKKRSCRRRLFDHNARRRKPHSSPLYGGSQQRSLLFNNTAWDNTSSSKFTLTKGCASSKPIGYGFSNEQMHTRMQGFVDMQSNAAAPEYGRALSLLSTNSSAMPLIPEGVPLSSPQVSHRSTFPRLQPNTDADFQEIQLLITPYHNHLYSNIIN